MVNPDHARPLMAFGLVAAAAAVITATGLQSNDAPTPATAATPVRASTSSAPDLVLGGVLRARPDAVLSNPLSPELWATGSPVTPTGGAVQVASPSGPTTTHKARTKAGGTQQSTAGGSHPSQTTTAPVSTASGGQGKGRGKPDQPARPTATTAATATPTGPAHPDKGRPDSAGH
jgi:hypothetical protein